MPVVLVQIQDGLPTRWVVADDLSRLRSQVVGNWASSAKERLELKRALWALPIACEPGATEIRPDWWVLVSGFG